MLSLYGAVHAIMKSDLGTDTVFFILEIFNHCKLFLYSVFIHFPRFVYPMHQF